MRIKYQLFPSTSWCSYLVTLNWLALGSIDGVDEYDDCNLQTQEDIEVYDASYISNERSAQILLHTWEHGAFLASIRQNTSLIGAAILAVFSMEGEWNVNKKCWV